MEQKSIVNNIILDLNSSHEEIKIEAIQNINKILPSITIKRVLTDFIPYLISNSKYIYFFF